MANAPCYSFQRAGTARNDTPRKEVAGNTGLSASMIATSPPGGGYMAQAGVDGVVAAQWARVRGRLKDEIGEDAFRNWLKALTLDTVHDGTAVMSTPTRFMRDWVERNFAERLRVLWQAENDGVRTISIVVTTRPSESVGSNSGAGRMPPAVPTVLGLSGLDTDRDSIGAPLDPRFTFDNFVVGKPNELAYAAARRVAEADGVPFNPLYLYGGVGLGKTHIMHAVGWHIRNRDPSRRVVYLSAEKFMYQFVKAIRHNNTPSFKEQYRSIDVLMVDDVQFIAGKDATQEEFFHTFNALVDQRRQIIISADKSPSDLEGMEERLRSRLGWGLVADLHPTTYELRLGILQSKADQMAVEIPAKVMEFLAHRITSNVRELEGALNRIVAHAQFVGREMAVETAQEVLHDLIRASDRRVTIDEIQKRVCEHFGLKLIDMSSPRRSRSIARPRMIAMYLSKQLTQRSLPEIGRKFGGRDHTTVMHACRKIEQLITMDRHFAEDVELLRRSLEA